VPELTKYQKNAEMTSYGGGVALVLFRGVKSSIQVPTPTWLSNKLVQAALVIRGFSIRGFDYSRTQKPRITRENCHFESKLS
jgi:hypothetical protein